MILAYFKDKKVQPEIITEDNQDVLSNAIWIDMLRPTPEEESFVEKFLNLEVPTREEMQEIEISSRLYKENGALFMTATMISRSDSPNPKNDAVTFIMTGNQLITVRYTEPYSFALFILRLSKIPSEEYNAINLLIEFLESTIDRLADILERVAQHIDEYSQVIFRSNSNQTFSPNERLDYKSLLQNLGTNGDLNTKTQENLISFNRLVTFFEHSYSEKLDKEMGSRLTTITKDIKSITNHASFLSAKVNFLLDATLGMVNIEQNNIIKIFSIAAVILLPPTLVASIYGMNFNAMPELSWSFGYPFAILLMIISAFIPYKYFKKKNWL